MQERLTRTFLIAAAGLLLMAWLRPSSPDPMNDAVAAKTAFFIDKTHATDRHDMLIMGDSRSLRCVAPEEMQAELPYASIYNFSFHAGGLNRDMFDAAEARLDLTADRPAIVMAVTALTLMPLKEKNEQYREYLAKPVDQVLLYDKAPRVAEAFQPLEPSVFVRKALNLTPLIRLEEDFRPTGWIATNRYPEKVYEELEDYEQRLIGHSIAQRLIDDLLTQVRDWRERGVEVYAFYPPAWDQRIELENRILGFSAEDFRTAFTSAGGVWLDVPDDDYHTYDGSHLNAESARRLSRRLALQLKSHL